MSINRKKYSPEFKAKVALAAIREEATISKVIDFTAEIVFAFEAIFNITFLLVLLLFLIKNALRDNRSTSTDILPFF